MRVASDSIIFKTQDIALFAPFKYNGFKNYRQGHFC
jgi:hypothetical protein